MRDRLDNFVLPWSALRGAVVAQPALDLMRAVSPITPPPRGAVSLGEGRRVVLGECLGRGSMATVYRGVLEDRSRVRRSVAIKLFGTIDSEERDTIAHTLERVTQRAACIRHPNVAATYEFGMDAGEPFIVAELIDGRPLPDLVLACAVHGRRLPPDIALFIAIEIADGLNGARVAQSHEGVQLGITHLDLSAREVMLSWNGEVKLTDFEVAVARQGASTVRSLRKLARRANTMSPEVARGEGGDARSDVFSLGILMHELLIGPRFPSSISDAEALGCAREGWVQPITFEPHLLPELREIIFRALAVDPDARFPNAGVLAYQLRQVALSLGVGDGRVFLRATMKSELIEERSEVTMTMEPAPPPVRSGARRRRIRHDEDED
jgi:serine/threonine-protein kinase